MKIIWSPLAVEQVQDISTYIALDKPSVAIEWTEKIFNSVSQLIEFPDSGRIVPEIKRKEIRELVLKNYRVIYKVKSKEILILAVKNYHQDLKKGDVKV